MITVILLILFSAFLILFYPIKKQKKEEPKSQKYTAQMKKLWDIAQESIKTQKPLRAEKALLTILKFDEKNAAAYNRLGILYAKQKKYDDAVDCFEIAQSIDSNPSSIHNAGLIYLEVGQYDKAVLAFEQAIAAEGDVPSRHIALAKAYEKMGDYKAAIASLENAYALDCAVATLRQILAIYELKNDEEGIAETSKRIEAKIAEDTAKKVKTSKIKKLIPKPIAKNPKRVIPAVKKTTEPKRTTLKKPTLKKRKKII